MKRWTHVFHAPTLKQRQSRRRELRMMTLEPRRMMAADAVAAVETPVVEPAPVETLGETVLVRDVIAFRPLARDTFTPIDPAESIPAAEVHPTADFPLPNDEGLANDGADLSPSDTTDPVDNGSAIDEALLSGLFGNDYEDVEKKEDFDAIGRKKYDEYCVEREINKLSHEKACKAIGIKSDSDLGKALKRVYDKEKS